MRLTSSICFEMVNSVSSVDLSGIGGRISGVFLKGIGGLSGAASGLGGRRESWETPVVNNIVINVRRKRVVKEADRFIGTGAYFRGIVGDASLVVLDSAGNLLPKSSISAAAEIIPWLCGSSRESGGCERRCM